MSRRKTISILIFLFTLGLFAFGCSSQSPPAGTNSSTESAQPQEPNTPAEPSDSDEARDAAAFFKGKTINFLVGYSPGGGFDTMARLIAPHLEKQIPGVSVLVTNRPGAGGIIAVNEIYEARPDGLTIGVINGTGSTMAIARGAEGIKFDLKNFSYIGRNVIEPKLIMGSAQSGFKSLHDVIESPNPVSFATTGPGSGDHQALKVIANAFAINNRFVTGYSGLSEARLAVVKNEAQVTEGALSSSIPLVESGDIVPLGVVAQEMPAFLEPYGVPRIIDVAANEEQKTALQLLTTLFELERAIGAPPGLPEDRLQVLRDAFEKLSHDPSFIEEAKALNIDLSYMSGPDLEKAMAEAVDGLDRLKPYLDLEG